MRHNEWMSMNLSLQQKRHQHCDIPLGGRGGSPSSDCPSSARSFNLPLLFLVACVPKVYIILLVKNGVMRGVDLCTQCLVSKV